jgi:hypothetical protein
MVLLKLKRLLFNQLKKTRRLASLLNEDRFTLSDAKKVQVTPALYYLLRI